MCQILGEDRMVVASGGRIDEGGANAGYRLMIILILRIRKDLESEHRKTCCAEQCMVLVWVAPIFEANVPPSGTILAGTPA